MKFQILEIFPPNLNVWGIPRIKSKGLILWVFFSSFCFRVPVHTGSSNRLELMLLAVLCFHGAFCKVLRIMCELAQKFTPDQTPTPHPHRAGKA